MRMASKQQSAACVVFSNSRSGGGKGGAVLKAFAATLGADRVFDLGANPHPEEILAGDDLVREATSDAGLRVIVCGGDGTMTWIMSAVDVARERRHLAPEDAKHRGRAATVLLCASRRRRGQSERCKIQEKRRRRGESAVAAAPRLRRGESAVAAAPRLRRGEAAVAATPRLRRREAVVAASTWIFRDRAAERSPSAGTTSR